MLMSAELKGCVTWAIYFFSHNCAKFHHYKVCVTDFREREPFWAPIREQFQKRSSWIGLRPNELFPRIFHRNFLKTILPKFSLVEFPVLFTLFNFPNNKSNDWMIAVDRKNRPWVHLQIALKFCVKLVELLNFYILRKHKKTLGPCNAVRLLYIKKSDLAMVPYIRINI